MRMNKNLQQDWVDNVCCFGSVRDWLTRILREKLTCVGFLECRRLWIDEFAEINRSTTADRII